VQVVYGYNTEWRMEVHSKLCIITPMVTKMHVILQSFVVLTWMRDTIELV
jgi:hypothetical protein